MCGRFTLRATSEVVVATFQLGDVSELPPRFNIAPTQTVATVVWANELPGRVLRWMRWGLVPSWAADLSIGSRMINARSETVATKPAFREALRVRRCLVLADGFFEWQSVGRKKQPYYIRMKDAAPFAFAGIWERWQAVDAMPVESCSVITTTANELVRPLHERMPVILHAESYAQWLGREPLDERTREALFRPYACDAMMTYPVNASVSNVRNDTPLCVSPIHETTE